MYAVYVVNDGGMHMISNQILQNTIDGLKAITKADFCVMDTEGKVLVSTSQTDADYSTSVQVFVNSPADSQTVHNCHFFKIFAEFQMEYILVVQGSGDDAYMIGKMAAFQLQGLLVAYRERFDKDNFMKSLLLDNLLLVDIYTRAKKLHIEANARRVVYILEMGENRDMHLLEYVSGLLPDKERDFATAVDEKHIIVVKELTAEEGYPELEQFAQNLLENMAGEITGEVHIAYGTIVEDIKEVSRSYKESKLALDVGKIFFDEKNVVAYNTLGIGRLIYQLPVPLCKMFIREVFEKKSPDDFDNETLTTINKFFENSLNVSETSRQLFIHRNTLVYRLDKIQKSTGLDLRVFEDAITFKIALMVVKYMKYMESVEF